MQWLGETLRAKRGGMKYKVHKPGHGTAKTPGKPHLEITNAFFPGRGKAGEAGPGIANGGGWEVDCLPEVVTWALRPEARLGVQRVASVT